MSVAIENGLNFRVGQNAGSFYNRHYSETFNDKRWKLLADNLAMEFGDSEVIKDAAYQFTEEEVTLIQSKIEDYLEWDATSADFIQDTFVGAGVRDLWWWTYVKVQPPRLTQDFTRGNVVYMAKVKSTLELIGFDYDMYFSLVDMDAMNMNGAGFKFSQNLWDGTKDQLIKSIVQWRERVIHFGTASEGIDDIGTKGLFNFAGINAPTNIGADGGDDVLTTAGDVTHGAITLANSLIQDKHKPPFAVIMSPGVYQQALININATSGETDMAQIMRIGAEVNNMFFNKVVMDGYLTISEPEVTATGSMGVVKNEVRNFEVVESYKIGFYPLPPQGLGTEGKILWMGGVRVKQPTAIAYRDTLTTSL